LYALEAVDEPSVSAGRRVRREQDFWGHHLPTAEECIAEFHEGPDPNTEGMLRAVGPLRGQRILDFACGTGVVSAWLSSRGAEVVGLDPSPEAITVANEVSRGLALAPTFVSSLVEEAGDLGVFDAVVGRYALHHTDVAATGAALARLVRPGGKAAFVETFATNPLLRFSRRHLIGRPGIPRLGTLDERPLGPEDIRALQDAFGRATTIVSEMRFLRILDRQVLHYRSPWASKACAIVDDGLGRLPRSASLSYHQVVVLEKVSR